MKNNNNNNQHHKNFLQVLPSKKPSLGVFGHLRHLLKKLAGSFWSSKAPIKKDDYRSVIDISFISDIVPRIVAISTSNKRMAKTVADYENILNNDDFFWRYC